MPHAISISQGKPRIRFYAGNIEYLNGQVQHIAFPDGRLVAEYNTSGTSVTGYRSEYFRTDHLGNTRLTFSDFNQDGMISWKLPTSGPSAQESEITSENHYYPFGLGQKGPWYASVAPENKYRYNGKEWNDEWGLNMYDYGARGYMPDLGRWGGVDALAERYYAYSGYNYVLGNPIRLFDPDGRRVEYSGDDERIAYELYRSLIQSIVNLYDKKTNELRERGKSKQADRRESNRQYNHYVIIQNELSALEKDEDVFRIRMGDNIVNPKGGGNISYNEETNEIDINISSEGDFSITQKLAHELTHASQYLNRDLDLRTDGTAG